MMRKMFFIRVQFRINGSDISDTAETAISGVSGFPQDGSYPACNNVTPRLTHFPSLIGKRADQNIYDFSGKIIILIGLNPTHNETGVHSRSALVGGQVIAINRERLQQFKPLLFGTQVAGIVAEQIFQSG